MSPRSRKEYFEAFYVRYKKASSKEKASILSRQLVNSALSITQWKQSVFTATGAIEIIVTN